MRDPPTVIWDFDGTLLPSTPYDSEQVLMLARRDRGATFQPLIKRWATHLIVEADRREWFRTDRRRRLYLGLYPRLLRGTPTESLDRIGRDLARSISESSRQAIVGLKDSGHPMVVVSCGTADLSERVLQQAEIYACFEWVAGNRFRFKSGKIIGMDVRMVTAGDKVRVVRNAGIDLHGCVVVGDGYTDLPLLDQAKTAVMMDPAGVKRHGFAGKGYHFVSTVCQAAAIISQKGFRGL